MERPIIFSTPMVQAIQQGRKTMTRRVVKFPESWTMPRDDYDLMKKYYDKWRCPYGEESDRLWVRETFMPAVIGADDGGLDQYCYLYKADGPEGYEHIVERMEDQRWNPSIYMPKVASRIFLEIEYLEFQKLQDITPKDAIREGIAVSFDPDDPKTPLYYFYPCGDLRDDTWVKDTICSFYSLWRSINGQKSWDENPFVWVIGFKRVEK